jgi:hypothetical protein
MPTILTKYNIEIFNWYWLLLIIEISYMKIIKNSWNKFRIIKTLAVQARKLQQVLFCAFCVSKRTLNSKLNWFLGRYVESFYVPPRCVRLFYKVCQNFCSRNFKLSIFWVWGVLKHSTIHFLSEHIKSLEFVRETTKCVYHSIFNRCLLK